MNIVEESEALSMKLTALKTDNEHLALRMLRYSRDHYEAAVRASTDNPKTLYRLADVLKVLHSTGGCTFVRCCRLCMH
jgi:hypothetical protein